MLQSMNQTLERPHVRPESRETMLTHLQTHSFRLLWSFKREAEAVFSALELRPLEAFALDYLARGSPHPKDPHPKNLADALGTSAPAVSILLRNLEARDLLTRRLDPDDHRRTRLGLTERGDALREQLSARLHALYGEKLTSLSENELHALTRVCTVLLSTNSEST